jgi:hypothetical protein
MPAFGRGTEKNIPKKKGITKKSVTKNRVTKNRETKDRETKDRETKNSETKNREKKSISIQTNQENNSNEFQKKLAHSLANLIPVLESQITKKIETAYLVKIHALENEIKRLKKEHSSLLYRNGLPTIHENTN